MWAEESHPISRVTLDTSLMYDDIMPRCVNAWAREAVNDGTTVLEALENADRGRRTGTPGDGGGVKKSEPVGEAGRA